LSQTETTIIFVIAKKETDPQVTVSPLLTAIPCAIREMVKASAV